MSVEFLTTSLVVVVIPGAGVLYTLAAALSRGARASVVAAIGCTLGIVPHVVAAIAGVAALMYTSAMAFQVVKYLGVVYLLYMAWAAWREKGALALETAPLSPRSSPKVIGSGILVNLLNPKLAIFFFAFLPQFASPTAPHHVLHMAQLSAVFMLLTLVVFVGYGAFASAVRDRILTRPRVLTWLRRTFAGAFVALCARLAVASR